MSYDIKIAVKVEDTDIFAVIAEPEYSSPTYNLREMFVACTGWDYTQGEFYKVEDVYDFIVHGIDELTNNEIDYIQYNPSNGWGSTTSAREALISMKECIDNIVDANSWTGWNTIPKKYLYISW